MSEEETGGQSDDASAEDATPDDAAAEDEATTDAGEQGKASADDPAATQPDDSAKPPERLRSVDLTGREQNLRAAMLSMAKLANSFARAARRTLPFLVWRKSHLVPQSVAIAEVPSVPPDDEQPSLHAMYQASDSSTWASLSLNHISLGLILEGALGASGDGPQFEFGAELTLAQRALAGRLIKTLGEDLVSCIAAESDQRLELVATYAHPGDAIDTITKKDGLSVDLFVQGVEDAVITIGLQAGALEKNDDEADVSAEQELDPQMQLVAREVPVDLVAELGRLNMGLRSILNLKSGQVLRLSTAVDDPIRVEVGGLKKFVGVPVVSRGQLAIEIKRRCGS